LGDEITGSVTVTQKDEKGKVWLQTVVVNQRGEAVLEGEAIILAPTSRYDLPG
jgi:acyl dehydratase